MSRPGMPADAFAVKLLAMPPISVVICCANVADTLEAACRSAGWADELLIVDSGSADDTPGIAKKYATRYVTEPWRGYAQQKKFGADLAAHDWVFILDGDEEISPQLAEEIQQLSDADLDAADVIYMRRRNHLMGRPVRAWWPDWQSRLIHRRRVHWPDEVLHEDRIPADPTRTRHLRGHLHHKRTSAAGFSDYFSGKRLDNRLLMVARQMHERGKRARWWDLLFRPWLTFLKFYLLKRGCLDGTFGLLVAQKSAISVQLKYAALWTVQNNLDQPADNPSNSEQTPLNQHKPPSQPSSDQPVS